MSKPLLPLLVSASLLAASILTATTVSAESLSFSDKIKQAMQSAQRSDKDKERDRNRLPVHTLEFFGIKDDMKVLELIPGSGWYSRLLASALRDNGQLYLGIGTRRVKEQKTTDPVYDKIKLLSENTEFKYNEEIQRYDLTAVDFQLNNIDAVLTFRNYHNFSHDSRMKLNQAIFDALKPGGIYGVVDHTRRHMQENDDENRRRFDPVLAIKEIQQSGFEFVDYSTVHYRLDDELRYEVGRKTVTGNTDRFTFLFKKPE